MVASARVISRRCYSVGIALLQLTWSASGNSLRASLARFDSNLSDWLPGGYLKGALHRQVIGS